MNNRFFSVVIPCYNRGGFIRKTIQSLLDQQFRDFEALVVDDGSTDNTGKAVAEIKDNRIRYFYKSNEERGAARNFGVQHAVGQYITFLDSDDLLKENHLQVAYQYITRFRPPVFHLGYDIVNEAGEVLYAWKKRPNPINKKLIEGNFLSCLGIFAQRHILLENSFNQDRALSGSEDYELWLRLAARYPIAAYSDVTAMLISHDTRSVVQMEPQTLIKRIELIRHYLMKDSVFVQRFNKRLGRLNAFLNIYLSLHLAMSVKGKREAVVFLRRAIVDYPAVILNKRFWAVLKQIGFNEHRA